MPQTPWYFFIKRNTSNIEHFNKWHGVNDIFPINVTGIVTARDGFVTGFDDMEIYNRMLQFRNLNISDDVVRKTFSLKDTRGWKLPEARKKLEKDPDWKGNIQKMLYRPFDIKSIYYTDYMVDWGRPEVMRHMLKENISLCFMRQYAGNDPYSHALVSEYMIDNRTFFSSKGIIQQAPLYLYDATQKKKGLDLQTMMLFEPEPEFGKAKGKRANISQEVFAQLKKAYGKVPTPEQILAYTYGILYSNIYREKYSEFLKIDFPRIPFTKSYELFKEMSDLGDEIIELHLLKHKALNTPLVKYRGKGTGDAIEKLRYDEKNETLYINEHRYFENVAAEVWKYQIGGYNVVEHYLKARKGRQMDDPSHVCKMATSIAKTIEIQTKIDKLFPKIEKKFIE